MVVCACLAQVAEAVAEALSAARGDAIIEVGADPAALPVPVADQVLQASGR